MTGSQILPTSRCSRCTPQRQGGNGCCFADLSEDPKQERRNVNENNEDDHRHAVHIRVSMMRMVIHRANECFGPGTVDKGTPRSGVKDQGVRDYHSLRGTAHVAPAVMGGRFTFSGAGTVPWETAPPTPSNRSLHRRSARSC